MILQVESNKVRSSEIKICHTLAKYGSEKYMSLVWPCQAICPMEEQEMKLEKKHLSRKAWSKFNSRKESEGGTAKLLCEVPQADVNTTINTY